MTSLELQIKILNDKIESYLKIIDALVQLDKTKTEYIESLEVNRKLQGKRIEQLEDIIKSVK